ncbi:MAG: biotin/lipoyl-binding protein [Clostridiales bacterium]|nr:biotin/lipoyl-binding protein [Clostridiales bacterium]MDD6341140.1 biotin/lipoyl-binding protein [Eubacteriales bacterium]
MKKYNVNVNGKTYQIEIEEVENFDPKKAQTPSAPAAPAAAPAPAQAPAAAPAAGGNTVSCPMPGTILDVRCSEGATVKKGDILFILEAMKMENEIMSPCDGTVRGVSVSKGASVDTGAVLCTIA